MPEFIDSQLAPIDRLRGTPASNFVGGVHPLIDRTIYIEIVSHVLIGDNAVYGHIINRNLDNLSRIQFNGFLDYGIRSYTDCGARECH